LILSKVILIVFRYVYDESIIDVSKTKPRLHVWCNKFLLKPDWYVIIAWCY